jgi:cell division protein FtsA
MINEDYVLGLDIGNSKICAAICCLKSAGEVFLKGVGTSIPVGLDKGKIVNGDELYLSIERAINRAQQNNFFKPKSVLFNAPLNNMQFKYNSGFFVSKEESGQISSGDKQESIRRSLNILKSMDQKVLHAMPIRFKVDGQQVKNPISVFGSKIEVDTHIVLGCSLSVGLLTKVIKDLNLHISGIVYDALASAQVFLSGEEKQEGVVLFDMGAQYTKISIFKNNMLVSSMLIPVAGLLITADIAYCLKVTIPEAERLKILYGDINLKNMIKDEKITVSTKEKGRTEISRLLLCRIIEARVQELMKMVSKKYNFPELGCHKIVVCGGSGQLKGLKSYLEKFWAMEVRVGLPAVVQEAIEDEKVATAIGMVIYGLKTGVIQHNKAGRGLLTKIKNLWRF